jgi:signal transduction histidine kinase
MSWSMGLASAMTAAFALVALCTAIFNTWIFTLRRQEAAHLWLAVAALGVTALGVGVAMSYEARTVEQSILAQRISIAASLPLVVGFLRFTAHFLSIRIEALERLAGAFAATGVVTLAGLRPDWLFTGESLSRRVAFTGDQYVMAALDWAGFFLIGGYLALFAATIPLYWRNASRQHGDGVGAFAAVAFWFLCALNDAMIALDFQEGPNLMVVGYVGFVVVFTATLLRRFVESMEQVEQSAEGLHQLVEARTAELREKEVALAHGERMATLGTLAAGIAHEINNPIAFVSANLNQITEAWKAGTAEAPEEILAETREGVERIRAIVQELLSLARRGEGVTEQIDLRDVVRSVLPILRHEARDRARIETSLQAVPPVLGDDRLLGQVVLNLALNGLQAIAPGRPGANLLVLSTAYEDGSTWLVVRDTGGGIPPDVLPKIFDAFFTTKAPGSGTGLGLAVTHQIVSQHRGRIDVETGPDGTQVTVELPPATHPVSAAD